MTIQYNIKVNLVKLKLEYKYISKQVNCISFLSLDVSPNNTIGKTNGLPFFAPACTQNILKMPENIQEVHAKIIRIIN